MQLREVGKLAVYLWKMQWLQRPRHWALLWTVCMVRLATLCSGFTVIVWGLSALPTLLYGGGLGKHLCLQVHPSVCQVAHMELMLCRGI